MVGLASDTQQKNERFKLVAIVLCSLSHLGIYDVKPLQEEGGSDM